MEIVRNLSLSKLIRIRQEDLNEALYDFCLKKQIIDEDEIDNWNISFPTLRISDLIKMERKILENDD